MNHYKSKISATRNILMETLNKEVEKMSITPPNKFKNSDHLEQLE